MFGGGMYMNISSQLEINIKELKKDLRTVRM